MMSVQPKTELVHWLQWGCLLVLLGITVVAALGGTWLLTRSPAPPPGPRPTAIIWTASPTPTATPTPIPTATPVPPPPTGIGIGARVRVSGTGSAGLNLRAEAGTTAERLGVAQEGEYFIVAGGPQEADALTWWFLRDEANPQREGWGAANYLALDTE